MTITEIMKRINILADEQGNIYKELRKEDRLKLFGANTTEQKRLEEIRTELDALFAQKRSLLVNKTVIV